MTGTDAMPSWDEGEFDPQDAVVEDEELAEDDWDDLEEPEELEFDSGEWAEDDLEDGFTGYVTDEDEDEAVGW